MHSQSTKNLSPPLKAGIPTQTRNAPSAHPLALFRILFGLVLTRFFWDLHKSDWIEQYFVKSSLIFKYSLFPFLNPLQPEHMHYVLYLLLAFSVTFTIGFYYRFSCICILSLYSYIFFIDQTWNTPSRYLILVVVTLFTLTNAHKTASLDARLSESWRYSRLFRQMDVPALHILSFKIIFTVIPIYSGLARLLSEDWMERAEPLSTWLFFGSVTQNFPFWGFLQGPEFGFSPSALVDLGKLLSISYVLCEIVGSLALWHRWTRLCGLICCIFVQLLNVSITQGSFPYIMIISNVVWLDYNSCRAILVLLTGNASDTSDIAPPKISTRKPSITQKICQISSKVRYFLLILFIVVQVVVPSFSYLGSHHPSWSNRGAFSWRILLNSQDTLLRWHVNTNPHANSPLTSAEGSILINPHQRLFSPERLAEDQWTAMLRDPSLLHQWSKMIIPNEFKFLKKEVYQVHNEVYRSVNGRPFQRWLRPDKSDLFNNDCSFIFGCDSLIEPQIEEFNTMDWMSHLQILTDESIQKSQEIIFMAERPGNGYGFQAKFQPFSEKLSFVLLSGRVNIDIEESLSGTTQPIVGEQVNIPFNSWHLVQPIGNEPACWAYTWTWPRNMTLSDALTM